MEKEDALIQVLNQISERLSGIERRQENDKKEMITSISDNKKEMLDKISQLETNNNREFKNISDSLLYERKRLDEIHEDRKNIKVNWSAKIMALNSTLAGIVAFIVSSFK